MDDCKVVRFLGAFIKPVHPCTGLIARFAQQNALLLRTTDIRVGTEKKHRGNKDGLNEYIIPNAVKNGAVKIPNISGINPEF